MDVQEQDDRRLEALRAKLAHIRAEPAPPLPAPGAGLSIGPDCPRCGGAWPWVTVRRGRRITACHHDVEFVIPGYLGRAAG